MHGLEGDISRGNLSTATVCYLTGNSSMAIGFIKSFRSKQSPYVLYIPTKSARDSISGRSRNLYSDVMCGRNLSRNEKASVALSYGFEAYKTVPVLPRDLLIELLLVPDNSYILSVNPLAYSCFLSFLCHMDLGDTLAAKTAFYDHLNPDHDVGIDLYLTSLMVGICHRMMGNYTGALCYFIRAFHEKRTLVEKYPHSGERLSFQSPLFYIALLLNLII